MAEEQVSGMTDEERFRFDLTGFLVRPVILAPDEIAAVIDHIDRIKHDPKSLPVAERGVPGGASSVWTLQDSGFSVTFHIIGVLNKFTYKLTH